MNLAFFHLLLDSRNMKYPKFLKKTNSLTSQIFLFVWLSFFSLYFFVELLFNFDARSYNNIEDNELHSYLSEIDKISKEGGFNELLNSSKRIPSKNRFDNNYHYYPILVDKHNNLIGTYDEEKKDLQQFVFNTYQASMPQKKRFYDKEIIGPFTIEISKTNDEYQAYFVHRVNPQREFVNLLFDHPLLMVLLIMLVTSPLLLVLSRKIAKPLKALQRSANEVARGNLSVNKNLENTGAYEFRLIGRSFNDMIRSLQEINNSQQRLFSDISHELRTPLTRLQLASALIRRRSGDSAELIRIETETERLDKMINSLLLLSRQQLNSHLLHNIFPIHEIWDDVIADAHFECEQRGLELIVHNHIATNKALLINGNLSILSSAVENLIRNAEKYAKNRIVITIRLSHKNQIKIVVDDDGDGVDESQYQQIFKPFYRVNSDRDRQTGGTGLGLAIVDNAVRQHQGKVKASKSPLGGLRIELLFPLWNE
ncbi:two-component system sensor histidine kinase CpxA [Mergibacter septicus]|nr:two-component system sensor histidine kinase CpxA [Mergibacter septicus]